MGTWPSSGYSSSVSSAVVGGDIAGGDDGTFGDRSNLDGVGLSCRAIDELFCLDAREPDITGVCTLTSMLLAAGV